MLAATAPAALPLAAIALRHLATSPQALALSNAAIQAYTQPTYTHSANTFPPSGSRAAGLRYFAEEAPAYAPVMTHAAAPRAAAPPALSAMEPLLRRATPMRKSAMLHLLISSPRHRLGRGEMPRMAQTEV